MYRSILVPLDGSPFGEYALPLAASIARRARANLQVVHVHASLAPAYAETLLTYENVLDDALRQSEQSYLDNVVKSLSHSSGVAVTAACLDGPIADALEKRAAESGADLTVMTTHGRGPLARSWLGSVADRLVRRMPMPVLVVRPQETKPNTSLEPVLQHVLVPLDGSALAEQIIEPAVELGSLMQARYTLLRVITPMVLGNYDDADPLLSGLDQALLRQLRTLHEEDEVKATSYLEGVAQRLRARGLDVRTRVVVHGQPAVAILEEAKALRADVVALQTHGRSGLPRLFLGSVADKVLRGSSVPVLVHRSLNN